MISLRMLRNRTAFSSFFHFLDSDSFKVARVSKCQLQAYWTCRPNCWFFQSKLTHRSTNTSISEVQDYLAYPSNCFSTTSATILVQARDIGKLCEELQNAIDKHRLDDAWNLHEQHMQIEGFPRKCVVNNFLGRLSESMDVQWVERAYRLAQQAFEEHKQNLLEMETLIYISLGLARCGLPIPASTVLRKLIEMEEFPPVTAWSAILAYMTQTPHGAFLAAELVLEISYLFQDGRVDPRKKSNEPLIAMKPNTTAFNIALAGSLLSGTTRKAEQLLDMMPHINVKADTLLLIVMTHIYERNGRIVELKKLKRHIDDAHDLSDIQFRQFYNCLLTCHLNFGDFEAASLMVLEMLQKAKKAENSLGIATLLFETDGGGNTLPSRQVSQDLNCQKSDEPDNSKSFRGTCISYEEFCCDRKFLKLENKARDLLGTLLVKLQRQLELVTTEHGILQPAEKIYLKMVKAFLEVGKTKDLAEFLVKAEKIDSSVSSDNSALVHVINTCISLGWLDQAHDLLDEIRLAGVRTGASVYAPLLKAYCKENRKREVTSLLQDVRKAGIQLDSSCYEALIQSKILQEDTQGAKSLFQEMKVAKIPRAGNQEFDMLVKGCEEGRQASLMSQLLQEIKEGQTMDSRVYDWNNVIHFFCKKRLMQDAEKAFKKMRSLDHSPNAQTFHSLVTGYNAIGGKYMEVTKLWGEMKVLAFYHGMKFDQELLDSVLYTFVRGGFFILANEAVTMMERDNMFIDKYKYRTLFLKYHKTLYKGRPHKFQTETQLKKREAALAFKKWIGLGK